MRNLRSVVLFLAILLSLTQQSVTSAGAAAPVPDTLMPNGRFGGGCTLGGPLESSGGSPCQTDDAFVDYWLEASIDSTWNPSDNQMEDYIRNVNVAYSGTDLNSVYDPTPTFTGGPQTDIIYRAKPQDFDSSTINYIGYVFCETRSAMSAFDCDQMYVNFLAVNGRNASTALACHETGHAVGLLHGADSDPVVADQDRTIGCMANPINTSRTGIGSKNIDNINDEY